MSHIAILESLGISEEELAQREAPFIAEGHTFSHYAKTGDTDTLIREGQDADILFIANMPIKKEVIDGCKNLKYLNIGFTGVDHVDLDACRQNGVHVSNASGYSTEAVSELTVGMAIDLFRDVFKADQKTRALQTKEGLVSRELRGKTVGIVGLGKIGTRSAELFHAFGCKILSHSRTIHADAPSYVTQTTLEEVLQQSDIVVLHCPATAETKNIIHKDTLALMRPTAVLINTARGPVVNASDLFEALQEGRIAAAASDVFDKEPPLSQEEPLLHAKNMLLTPHIGFATEEAMTIRAEILFDNLRSWLDGKQENVIL